MSNFAQLSAGDGTLFLLRWRGRQEGPYTGSTLEAKLTANEIGLLHEIYYEGQWITIRDYITEKTPARQPEIPRREEPEPTPPSAAGLKVRREEMRPAEVLADEKLKFIRPESLPIRVSRPPPLPVSAKVSRTIRFFGIAVVVVGYFIIAILLALVSHKK